MSGDDVVRTTGWVFNNETGPELTLAQFVATGDSEVPAYLTVFGFRTPDIDQQTIVEIGCGIGRMTCAFTREYGSVVACDLDAGFLERTHETVGQFGRVDRLRTIHVADGQTLDLPPNSADVAFSYITLQHCDIDDALDLTAEAVRVTRPGGKIALNYRARSGSDVFLLPLGAVARASFSIPGIGTWLSQRRTAGPLGLAGESAASRPGHRTARRAAERHRGVAASEEQDLRLRRRDQDVRRHQPPPLLGGRDGLNSGYFRSGNGAE